MPAQGSVRPLEWGACARSREREAAQIGSVCPLKGACGRSTGKTEIGVEARRVERFSRRELPMGGVKIDDAIGCDEQGFHAKVYSRRRNKFRLPRRPGDWDMEVGWR